MPFNKRLLDIYIEITAKAYILVVIAFNFLISSLTAQQVPKIDYAKLVQTHDITSLPVWGPYSNRYAGISHIPDIKSGIRFDFSVMPGYYFYKTMIPNVRFESGYFPWEVNSSMDKIIYRYELEWKDRVYTDVKYSIIDSSTVLITINNVNNTSSHQVITLNNMANLVYPDIYSHWDFNKPKNVKWINALSYSDIQFAKPEPQDHLVYNGWLRGEIRNNDYIDGRAIAKGFGKNHGDKIQYLLKLNKYIKKGVVCFRYRMKENTTTFIQISGLIDKKIKLFGTGNFQLLKIPYEIKEGFEVPLLIESLGGCEIELNGFLFGNKKDINNTHIVKVEKQFVPEITNETEKHLILKYPDINIYYGIAWDFKPILIREVFENNLDSLLKENEHNTSSKILHLGDNNNGHYTNIFMRPINIAPYTEKKINAIISCGNRDYVENQIESFNDQRERFLIENISTDYQLDNILPEGAPYTFSQKMMQATLLTNVTYPVYTQNQYIRHFTPGKRWNSLYTWDNGFISIGLNEIDPRKALECLNSYTTPVGSQSAFIHHGTPMPVQLYAFHEYWNKFQSADFLKYFYPRMKQYYEFLAGKTSGSTTCNLKSNLLRTWDYFYNSGGWDDYPAQVAVHEQKLESKVSPVATTAHIIRVAKILRLAAKSIGKKSDIQEYDKDIAVFSDALQKYSWDKNSEYYSYVIHDNQGNPIEFLKHSESGENYNMGLDGVYPLLSGICTNQQQSVLLEKIFSDEKMWTNAGISVVDQTAPYYKSDGYWNGWVWMPHQWFIWKTMLDLGMADLAYKIASKGLNIWKNETDNNYYTYEIFQAETGRGAGWHHFSGLSTPVLSWFNAYYKIGTVTTGFEIWINNQSFAEPFTSYEATLEFDQATEMHQRSIIICMNPEKNYKVTFHGSELKTTCTIPGQLQITLPPTNEKGILKIIAIK